MNAGCCRYFAYGSNMSPLRLKKRVPSAELVGVYSLRGHQLKFHKFGKDGSAKCDAWQTGKKSDTVHGVLYEIDASEKKFLDEAEGLGNGYGEKEIELFNTQGETRHAFLYYATKINNDLSPFSWYVNHVLIGAVKAGLPEKYIKTIHAIQSIEDNNRERAALERSIYENIV